MLETTLELPADPIEAFETWLNEATQKGLPEPTAMTLATVTANGKPSARIVLFKGIREGGFSFVTNYDSRKGRELETRPEAALVFHWATLERQVRVEGKARRWSNEESDRYFQSRPRGSQIGAWSSPQSQKIEGRVELEAKVLETEKRFDGQPVLRPPYWGGYSVLPERIEFWEGRASRLHERFVFELKEGTWVRSRLAP